MKLPKITKTANLKVNDPLKITTARALRRAEVIITTARALRRAEVIITTESALRRAEVIITTARALRRAEVIITTARALRRAEVIITAARWCSETEGRCFSKLSSWNQCHLQYIKVTRLLLHSSVN